MKKFLYGFILVFAAVYLTSAQVPGPGPAVSPAPSLTKVEASPSNGFSYPYFLYVPPALKDEKLRKTTQTILVLPNNTGKIADDLKVHEDYIIGRSRQSINMAERLGVAILIPLFPRPETDWTIYTHALDRDSMLTDKKEYSRFDLQLIAMIDHARLRLAKEKIKTDKRVLIMGFSASGMFSNRFTFLHPSRVKGAAIGSPGGWPIAPAADYKGRTLRYPIGTGDFKATSGRSFDKKTLQKVPLFIFMGDKDDNDSLPFGDGYEDEDREIVFGLFGDSPVSRWEISKKLYADNKMMAEFKLYPGIKHMITKEMFEDIYAFLEAHK